MRTLQEIQPGMTLGRYEFLVPIAEGGMASVWAARLKGSRGFSKNVAVKTMLPSVSDDPQFEQMFLDEAQIASRIRHPNVVEILDLGEQDEVLYLVMEWVDGEPLGNLRRAAAKHGGIPRSIAVRIVADSCAGLHAAHELKDDSGNLLGLVHRDISPQNVLITFDGVVKIVDFGVAKAAGRSSEATTAGQVKGKPPYMSPEQALGEPVDRRTDVFALGIILYQLTTGKHPFRGESDLVTLQNIVSDRPIVPPRAYDKTYPRLLNTVVMKALDRDRDKRFQNCADFEAALDEVFASELARARSEDVGNFVTQMLGHKGEERRKALRDAILLADDRASGRGSLSELAGLGGRMPMPSYHGTPVSSPGITSIEVPGQIRSSRPSLEDLSDLGLPPGTPFGATLPASQLGGSRGRTLWVVVGGLAAVVGIASAVALGGESEGDSAEAAAARPVADPEPVITKQEPEPEPAPTAESVPEPLPEVEPAPSASVIPVASKPKPWRPPAKPRNATTPTKPAEPAASPAPPKPKPKPKQSGFVPPPMTDPGF